MFGRTSTSRPPTPDRAGEAVGGSATALAQSAGREDETVEALWQPARASARKDVAALLLERGHLTDAQLILARRVQQQTPHMPLGRLLLDQGAVTESQLLSAEAELLDLPFEKPTAAAISRVAFALLPTDFVRRHQVLPMRFEKRVLVVGMIDPSDVFLLDEVRRLTRRDVRVVVITSESLSAVLGSMAGVGGNVAMDDIIRDMTDDDVTVVAATEAESAVDLERAGADSPVVRFVNYLIFDAIKQGASDIHIEPKETQLCIRYRIDGLLFSAMSPPHAMAAAITSRLKIMANLDIAERRLPQDGRIRAMIQDRKVDLRMSTLPTVSGEKVVMRILDNNSISVSLDDLGFGEHALTIWKKQIEQPHGILLVTGPTGSGKTTTLYSSLRQMDATRLNISTVEDPVEYHLASVNQTQTHEKIGMTFAKALKALLRQDPDVVMLGEIRDAETAGTAVQAALTGHLVLSTLHTNDAPSSVTRLINIGVEPYLISSALNAVLAQRLVRKICPQCKEQVEPSDEMRDFLQLQGWRSQKVWKGIGCDRCRKTGYAGRLGIYEMMLMDDALRDVITRNPDVTLLRKLCRERGLVTLREDGFAKAEAGLTTIDEVMRVTENAV